MYIHTDRRFCQNQHFLDARRPNLLTYGAPLSTYQSALLICINLSHHVSRAPFCFSLSEEEKRLCLNRIKPSKSPQPKLLDQSIIFSLAKLFFFKWKHLFVDKPMVKTEPAVSGTWLLGLGSKLLTIPTCSTCSTKILLNSCRVFLQYVKIKQAEERLFWWGVFAFFSIIFKK